MEKLNLVEILNGCPKGTPLYSQIIGECALSMVWTDCDTDYPIEVESTTRYGEEFTEEYTSDGRADAEHDGECLLWPSRDCRDWSQFVPPVPKPKHHFKPFDRVLVRDDKDQPWSSAFFQNVDVYGNFWYHQIKVGCSKFCIPYDGNEHLEYTKDEPKND